jgi:hypothetical protein
MKSKVKASLSNIPNRGPAMPPGPRKLRKRGPAKAPSSFGVKDAFDATACPKGPKVRRRKSRKVFIEKPPGRARRILDRYGITPQAAVIASAVLVGTGVTVGIFAPVAIQALAASSAAGPIVLASVGAALALGVLGTAIFMTVRHYRATKALNIAVRAANAEAAEARQEQVNVRKLGHALALVSRDYKMQAAKELLVEHNLDAAFEAKLEEEARRLSGD